MEFEKKEPGPVPGERGRSVSHSSSLKHKILVPVTGTRASFYALDMAFLLSSRVSCDITALYLVKPDEFQPLKNHHADFLEMIEQKVRPELNEARKWNEFMQSIQFRLQVIEDSGANTIAEIANKGSYHFVVLWVEKPKKHFLGPVFSEKPLSLKVMGMLNCPLICIPEQPPDPEISSILLPLDDKSDSLLKIKNTIPIAKAMRASISLLIVLDDSSGKEVSDAQRLLDLCKEFLKKHGIAARSKIIFHHSYTDTILAYASITQAALISNGFFDQESFLSTSEAHIQRNIMLYSQVPTFNYFYGWTRD